MRKKKIALVTSVILALTLCLSMLPLAAFASEGTPEYKAVSSLDDLAEKSSCVIVAQSGESYYALGTAISGKITGTEVSVADGNVTSDALPVWNIKPEEKGYSLSNGTNYLAYGSSTNLKSSTDAYAWNITGTENGTFTFTSVATETRGIIFRISTGNQFGAYATSNASNADYVTNLMIFKSTATTPDITTLLPTAAYEGELEVGTTVTLSCDELSLSYEVSTDETNWTALDGNTYTVPSAEPGDYKLFFRAVLDGRYSKTVALEYSVISPDAPKADLNENVSDGDVVYIYNASSSTAISATANSTGKKLLGAKATVADDKLIISEDMLALTVSVDENGYYSFVANDGSYLTSGATGNSLTLEESASDYSLWVLESAEGGFYVKNANAVYVKNEVENPQYLEYYSGYTTFSFSSSKTAIYTFSFFTPETDGPTDSAIMGDVNLDGTVDINDATELQKIIVGLSSCTDVQKTVSDVNKDGVLSVRDVTEIQKYCAGIITEF